MKFDSKWESHVKVPSGQIVTPDKAGSCRIMILASAVRRDDPRLGQVLTQRSNTLAGS